MSQNVKQNLKKILAWSIIDCFVHNLGLISLARKIFQPQNSDDETILADETFVWDPERSHPSFITIPIDISSQAITKTSIIKDYVRLTPLTIDATPINYTSIFTDRERNNSLNSTFINQESLNGRRNRTQQDIQTPSRFDYEEIVETMPTKKNNKAFLLFIQLLQLQKEETQYFHKQLYNRQ